MDLLGNGDAYTGDVVIPETITVDDVVYTVNTIGETAFLSCDGVTSITMPNTIKTMEPMSIYGMDNIASVVVSDSLETIGNLGFAYCDKLASITIPQSVTSMGYEVFEYCPLLTTVNFNAKNVTSYGSTIFPSNVTTVNIGDSVQSLPAHFIAGCNQVKTITLPSVLTSIGDSAFYNCTALRTIYSKNASVPECISSTFLNVNTNHCVVYVPEGSFDSYTWATGWMDFINIEESATIVNNKETAINNVNASTSSAQAQGKVIEDGRLVIRKNGKKYNYAGQRMM